MQAISLLLAPGFVLGALAQTSPVPAAAAPAAPSKIAVVVFQSAVSQTNEFQRNFAELQKKFEPKRQEIAALSDEIESLQSQMQAQGDKLSDAERAARLRTIDEKKKKAQRSMDDSEKDFQEQMQESFGSVASKVYEVVVAYAKQQGYTLVLDVSQRQKSAPLVLYASESTNITKAVIEAYNVKSGVPAPPPPQPSAPTPARAPATH